MYHRFFSQSKQKPRKTAAFLKSELLLFLCCVFALLVGNAAGGLASGLAGGLAFAATAVLSALFQISGFYRLNSLHGVSLLLHFDTPIITIKGRFVKCFLS
jgi:hypothetical protein